MFKIVEDRILALKCKSEESVVYENNKNKESNREIRREYSQMDEMIFLKQLLKLVRLPLINIKSLVTDIKFSGFFEIDKIFEAI